MNIQKSKAFYITLLFSLCALAIFAMFSGQSVSLNRSKPFRQIHDNDLDFNTYDNITGYPSLIVPNIVHYVLFNVIQIEFGHYVSILSVLKNQKPDIIYIHCDCDQLFGQFYQKVIERVKQTKTVFKIRKIVKPIQIFGIPLSKPWINWHASDITRIRVIQEFGGIYLDRDMYVVKSLDVFRKFEMTVEWENGDILGNMIFIGNKNTRFLKIWLDSYHGYNASQWYYNAGIYPTNFILKKHPGLVHRVEGGLGVNGPKLCPILYNIYYPNWRKDFYSIHLCIRGDEIVLRHWCFEPKTQPKIWKFNEHIAQNLNVTFGEMYRDLFIE